MYFSNMTAGRAKESFAFGRESREFQTMLRRPFKRQGSGLGGPRKKFKPPRRIAGGSGSHALGGAGARVPGMPPPATAAPRSAVDPSQRRSSADTTRPAATRPVATTTFSSSSASPAAGAAAGADAAAFKAPAAPIASRTLVRKVIRPEMVLNSYGADPKASIATTTSRLPTSSKFVLASRRSTTKSGSLLAQFIVYVVPCLVVVVKPWWLDG